MGSTKAQELRALLGLAIKLRTLAKSTDDLAYTELFCSAALALEDRAHFIAYGTQPARPHQKVDMIC